MGGDVSWAASVYVVLVTINAGGVSTQMLRVHTAPFNSNTGGSKNHYICKIFLLPP